MTLWLLAMAAFGSTVSLRVCDPMLPALAAEFHASTGDASAVISSFALAYGLLQLFYGPLGDRIGKARVVVGATLACALFALLTAAATTLPMLVAARALMGASGAGIVPMSLAWIGDRIPEDRRQVTLARFSGATLSGMLVGQWFGGYAAEHLGWRTAFYVLAGIFLFAAVMLFLHVRTQTEAPGALARSTLATQLRGNLRLFEIPRVRWILAFTGVEGLLAFGATAFLPTRLVDHYHFSLSEAGTVMLLWAFGGMAYSQFAKRWLGLLGERGVALGGGVLLMVSLLTLAWSSQPWVAACACFVAGVGLYMLHNTLQTQATQMAPQARGTAVTTFACVLFLLQSLGVWALGWSQDHGVLAQGYVVCALCLLVLGTWVSRHVRPRAPVVMAAGSGPGRT